MTETRSETTIIMETVADQALGLMRTLAKEWQHPFGQKKVGKAEARRLVRAMVPQERADLLARLRAQYGDQAPGMMIDLMGEGGG